MSLIHTSILGARGQLTLCTPIFVMLFLCCCTSAVQTPRTSDEEVQQAADQLQLWIDAHQQHDYFRQWQLTDPRIRRWFNPERWRDMLQQATAESGDLLSWNIISAGAVEAENLPCSEMGHCFRKGVQYIAFVISTEYSGAAPQQPEYAVMAKSDEGWRFGGGTFPDRPFGETTVILDRADEEKYRNR